MMTKEVTVLECPKCGRQGFVRCDHTEDDVFICIYCNYSEDLEKEAAKKKASTVDFVNGIGIFLLSLAVSISVLLLLGL
ncbi:MAG TPA: hypothetical protein IGS37_04175 [Synechococcales cyanobacterium M55_K2018_004]|nr:hypothetical protein [Synechococcales cyanobacterium M55_K2018_004]